jgi:hypothetical protein
MSGAWSCSKCTLINEDADAPACSICETLRPKPKSIRALARKRKRESNASSGKGNVHDPTTGKPAVVDLTTGVPVQRAPVVTIDLTGSGDDDGVTSDRQGCGSALPRSHRQTRTFKSDQILPTATTARGRGKAPAVVLAPFAPSSNHRKSSVGLCAGRVRAAASPPPRSGKSRATNQFPNHDGTRERSISGYNRRQPLPTVPGYVAAAAAAVENSPVPPRRRARRSVTPELGTPSVHLQHTRNKPPARTFAPKSHNISSSSLPVANRRLKCSQSRLCKRYAPSSFNSALTCRRPHVDAFCGRSHLKLKMPCLTVRWEFHFSLPRSPHH